jgi:adenylate cyclase
MKESSPDLLQVEKSDVIATLLFCDVVGYTRLTTGLTIEQLIKQLSSYMTVVVNTVEENRGTVAKFIGDAIFAYWLEEEQPDHAKLACRFATSIRERLSAASCDVTTQIGIHTGRVTLVRINQGIYRSLEPMGDAVNLASRLDGLCALYQAPAIASEQVIAHGGGGAGWNALESVAVKGRKDPITLFKLG